MKYSIGDTVLVRDIVFGNGTADHSPNGRPCLILFIDKRKNKEIIYVLPFTTKVHKLHSHSDASKYSIVDISTKLILLDLSYVHQVENANITAILWGISKDYFRIVKDFKNYHSDSKSTFVNYVIYKLGFLEENRDILEPYLLNRYKYLKDVSRQYFKDIKEEEVLEDDIAKKLVKKKINHFKSKREEYRISGN